MISFIVVLPYILLQHALHAGFFLLSEISIRALAHSWLGFVFPSTERRSSEGACPGSSYRSEHLATSYRCLWWWSRSQRSGETLILSFVRRGVPDDPYFWQMFILDTCCTIL